MGSKTSSARKEVLLISLWPDLMSPLSTRWQKWNLRPKLHGSFPWLGVKFPGLGYQGAVGTMHWSSVTFCPHCFPWEILYVLLPILSESWVTLCSHSRWLDLLLRCHYSVPWDNLAFFVHATQKRELWGPVTPILADILHCSPTTQGWVQEREHGVLWPLGSI